MPTVALMVIAIAAAQALFSEASQAAPMLDSVRSDLVLAMVMAQTIFLLQDWFGREMWSDHRFVELSVLMMAYLCLQCNLTRSAGQYIGGMRLSWGLGCMK